MACNVAVKEGFLEEEVQPRRQVKFKRIGPSSGGTVATLWVMVEFDPIWSLGPG